MKEVVNNKKGQYNMGVLGVSRRNFGKLILLNFRQGTIILIIGLVLLSFSSSINHAVADDSTFANMNTTDSQGGTPSPMSISQTGTVYPLHTNITATVFWVGEPVGNGSSEDNALTAYDDNWLEHYGGFDEYRYRRTPENNYFPTDFVPKENPFYLDLPYDDLNVSANRNTRTQVIPWAIGQPDPGRSYSFMKNRWVRLEKNGKVCYGQNEDAGPYVYNDANYVFGTQDQRPKSTLANNAGLDVSPALRDCLGFKDINGASDKVNWQFVDNEDVPDGPWKVVVTTSGVDQGGASSAAPADINLINNSGFYGGELGWNFSGEVTHSVVDRQLRFYRRASSPNGASVYQTINHSLRSNFPMELNLDLGNASNVTKNVQVQVYPSNRSESFVCNFAIPAGATPATFTLRSKTKVGWSNVAVAIQAQDADGISAIIADNVDLQYRPSLNVTNVECVSPNQALVPNGDFSNGLAGWNFWGEVTHSMSNGQLRFYRQSPSPNGASVYQVINHTPPANTVLELNLDLGNTGSATKNVQVQLYPGNWADYFSCTFTLPANTPMETLTLRAKTSVAWSNMVVVIQPLNADGLSAIVMDNVELETGAGGSVSGTECISPNQALIMNGDFSSGELGWNFWGEVTHSMSNGQLRFYRQSPSPNGASVYQVINHTPPANTVLELNLDLGNTSAATKNVQVQLYPGNWADYFFCNFTIPANTPAETVTLRGKTSVAWSNIVVVIQPLDADGLSAITMDNVALETATGGSVSGTECISPNQALIMNGDFSSGELGWNFWGEVTHTVTSGHLQFYRQTPSPNGASIYQVINHTPPANTVLELNLDLGNTSAATKNVQVQLYPGNWADYFFCNFAIPANTPAETLTLRGKTSVAWSNIVVVIQPLDADGLSAITMDNVALETATGGSVSGTECEDGQLPANLNLVQNPDFSEGDKAWTFTEVSNNAVISGVLEFWVPNNEFTNSVSQDLGYSTGASYPLQAKIDLGNLSEVAKTVRVTLRNASGTDAMNCDFILPSGAGIQTYTLTGETFMAWDSIVLEMSDLTTNSIDPIQVDNISVIYDPSLAPINVECASGTGQVET